jgi:hypothetical protein
MDHLDVIDSWLENNKPAFTSYGSVSERFSLTTRDEWKSPDEAHDGPGAEFFRRPALVFERKTQFTPAPPPVGVAIADDLLVFQSADAPGSAAKLPETIIDVDPLYSIIPDPFPQLQDVRRPGDPIRLTSISYITASYDGIKSNHEVFEPILLSMFVFDVATGQRVSETWSFMVPDPAGKPATEEGFRAG